MKKVRILILDEDDEMRSLIAEQLALSDFDVAEAGSFGEALKKLAESSFTLFLLDAKIPDFDTAEVIRWVRANEKTRSLPIIVLAPKFSEAKQCLWSEAGANEFLIKPYDRALLLSKIKAMSKIEEAGQVGVAGLTLDLKSFDVFCRGVRTHLTPNEFKLLEALLNHAGIVLSRERLIELVQGYGIAVIDRAVDTHIFSLRKKLKPVGDFIETVRGTGYRIRENIRSP